MSKLGIADCFGRKFERGTISYMLTASLTRHTTISPVAFCDRKLNFLDVIDIAPLSLPKPQEVSLKAVSKRSRVKQIPRRHTSDHVHHAEGPSWDGVGNRRTSDSQDGNQAPRSPCPSELSFDSFASSGRRNSHVESGPRSSKTSDSGKAHTTASSNTIKIITAHVELLTPGGLPGDHIPLRIMVNHVKHVKSLHGVIVTMFRQARVDMHPVLPLGPMKKGEKEKFEDYYPKSLTGLGGLSLSAAGSSQNFRKDLSQHFTPLIIDPTTLTADVKAAVQIPEDAFPTISQVPGAMISFRYYVEVVLDLQGKLASQDKFLPSIGLLNQPTSLRGATGAGQGSDGRTITAWDGNIIDTEPIRREKSIVSCVFEIIIGTKDSERRKGKRRAEAAQDPELPEQVQFRDNAYDFVPPGDSQESYNGEQWAAEYYGTGYGYNQQQDLYWDQYQNQQNYGAEDYQYQHYGPGLDQQQAPVPSMAEQEAQLSEKERLRRAEERLLPSEPPGHDGEEPYTSGAQTEIPSAPVLADGPLHWNPGRTTAHGSSQGQAQSNADTRHGVSDSLITGIPDSSEPVPPYSSLIMTSDASYPPTGPPPPHGSSSLQLLPTDDKAELQRRRLQMEASSPDDVPEPEDDRATGVATARRVSINDRPTAPVIEQYAEDTAGSSKEQLRHEQ